MKESITCGSSIALLQLAEKEETILTTTLSWMIPAVVVGSLVFIATVANPLEGSHMGIKEVLEMKDELGLSNEQVSKLRALKSQTEKRIIRIKSDLEILELELQDLLQDNKVNVKAVDSKIEKIGELRTEMQKVHVHVRLDAQKVLTSEQLKKLHEHKGKGRHEKQMHRHGIDELI